MTHTAPLSPVDLRRILTLLFDDEELRTLCFDLNVDYDSLRGEGKAAKARELVALAERLGQMELLEAAVRRERPDLDTAYSPERVQQLQASIMAQSDAAVRDAFTEFTQQIDAYLNRFNLLHAQLQEWKEVHNLLQDIQTSFAPCRSYIYTLSRLNTRPEPAPSELERTLYEVEVEWRPCRRMLRRLEHTAANIETIGSPYDPETERGPEWFLVPRKAGTEVDRALFDDNPAALAERLSVFGDQVDQFLYLADKALRDVVVEINHLPRPGPYTVRAR
ncbi:MAG: hypothetical protein PVI59_13705 [Anaerolineae bacterium]|jgi:hypothetical protein